MSFSISTRHVLRTLQITCGNMIRETGQAMERLGARSLGQFYCAEPLSRHRQLMSLSAERPMIAPDVFITPCASLIGSIHLASGSSVWYGAVIRGDDVAVLVGEDSNIQDRAVLVPKDLERFFSGKELPIIVGKRVSVGHGAILNNCVLEDECMIGMGAIVGVACKIGKHAIIAPGGFGGVRMLTEFSAPGPACILTCYQCVPLRVDIGSVVASDTNVPSGELWSGSPAAFERKVTKEEIHDILKRAKDYRALASKHMKSIGKTPDQITLEGLYDDILKDNESRIAKEVNSRAS